MDCRRCPTDLAGVQPGPQVVVSDGMGAISPVGPLGVPVGPKGPKGPEGLVRYLYLPFQINPKYQATLGIWCYISPILFFRLYCHCIYIQISQPSQPLRLIGYLLMTSRTTTSKAQIARAPVTRGGTKVYGRLDFVYFLSIHLKGLEETWRDWDHFPKIARFWDRKGSMNNWLTLIDTPTFDGSIVKKISHPDDGTFFHPGPGTMGNYPAWCQAVRLVCSNKAKVDFPPRNIWPMKAFKGKLIMPQKPPCGPCDCGVSYIHWHSLNKANCCMFWDVPNPSEDVLVGSGRCLLVHYLCPEVNLSESGFTPIPKHSHHYVLKKWSKSECLPVWP